MKKIIVKFKDKEDGVITVYLCLMLTALIVLLGITMDLGNTYLTHLRMRNAVDIAAIAVMDELPAPNTQASRNAIKTEAQYLISRNFRAETANVAYEWTGDDEYIFAVKIIMERNVPAFFAGFYANSSSAIRVGAFVYADEDSYALPGYTVRISDIDD